MFRFAHPEYLNALYAVPLLIILFWFLNRNRKKILEKFADKKLQKFLFPSYSGVKNTFKFLLIIFSITLLILAIANPQIGTRMEEVKQTGIDVFILLDVSNSMRAEDIKPNRLEKAKLQISNLIRRLRGDRIGLVIFAGEAYIQIPLTTDYSAAGLFLSAVDFNSVPQQGTAIGSAISLALKSFDYSAPTEKAIIIITDGEDHQGDIDGAVNEAVNKEIKIFTIGLGSVDGTPIPVYTPSGEQIGFKKDQNGNVVITKLDEITLKRIASAGKGEFYRGTNFEDNLDQIYNELAAFEKTEFGTKKVTDYEDRFYYFLAPALILLIIEFFVSEKKSPFFAKINKKFGIE
jgi:Ca-activated chloride channel family protein